MRFNFFKKDSDEKRKFIIFLIIFLVPFFLVAQSGLSSILTGAVLGGGFSFIALGLLPYLITIFLGGLYLRKKISKQNSRLVLFVSLSFLVIVSPFFLISYNHRISFERGEQEAMKPFAEKTKVQMNEACFFFQPEKNGPYEYGDARWKVELYGSMERTFVNNYWPKGRNFISKAFLAPIVVDKSDPLKSQELAKGLGFGTLGNRDREKVTDITFYFMSLDDEDFPAIIKSPHIVYGWHLIHGDYYPQDFALVGETVVPPKIVDAVASFVKGEITDENYRVCEEMKE